MNTAELDSKYGIAGRVAIVAGEGGIPEVQLTGPASSAKISLLGAHVLSWIPTGSEDVMWMSSKSLFAEGKAIRGGIPVCWPWFSKHPENDALPMHGFARIMLWDLVETKADVNETTAIFSLKDTKETRSMFPNQFSLQLTVRAGKNLNLSLTTCNTGDSPFTITEALHTYFNIGDISKVSIDGFEGLSCINKLQDGAINIRKGTFVIDRGVDEIYFDSDGDAVIHDGLGRNISITKKGSNSAVIWNPWIEKSIALPDFPDDGYKTMLCVETANVADDKRTIQPGSSHTLELEISL